MANNNHKKEAKPPEVGIVDLFDAAILQKQDEEIAANKSFGFPLRPSASGKCARALAYELHEHYGHAKYEPEVKNASTIRLLEFGHDIERHVLNMMKRAGIFQIKYQQQVVTFCELEDGRLIEGSVDFVAVFDDYAMIGDVKSKGVKWSAGYASSWEEDTAKYQKLTTLKQISDNAFYAEDVEAFLAELNDSSIRMNVMQLNGYACTDFMQARGIEYAFLLQYNKANSTLREIRWKVSPKLADYVHEKFKAIHKAITSNAGPEAIDREEVLGSMSCAFCRFKTNCWPEVDTKKAFFQTLPDKQWATDTSYLGDRGDQLEAVYAEYAEAKRQQKAIDNIEQRMLKLMLPDEGRQVKKVKFRDGTILEARFLKSPYPGYQLRPGKVK
jgi:CRISPR/Cas system-associated exonuclease Cas4 (RecB family)